MKFFDSMPVAANVTDNFPTYTITVTDSSPIWVYCAQAAGTPASHCGQGMVFAVNCGADGSANSFTNFKNAALAVGQSLSAAAASSTPAASVTDPYGTPASTTAAPAESTTAAASGTASGAAATHTIVVGGSQALTFSPSEVQAAVNDVVVFEL